MHTTCIYLYTHAIRFAFLLILDMATMAAGEDWKRKQGAIAGLAEPDVAVPFISVPG